MHYNEQHWPNSRPVSVNLGQGDRVNMTYPFLWNDQHDYVDMCLYGGIYDAYQYCPPLASILGMCADAFTNAEYWALNKNTENDVRGTKKEWQKILDQPNLWQDSAQFFKQLYTLRKLYGWCYVYKKKAVGFDRPSSLVVLPNWLLRIETKEQANWLNNPEDGREIYLCFKGSEIKLKKEDLIFFSDNTVFTQQETQLPQSRYAPQQKNINTIIGALDAQELLIRKKGALGILSNGSTGSDQYALTAVSEKEKQRVQHEYDKYGLNSGQMRVIITEYPLRWQSMSLNVSELGIESAILNAIKGLCDATNFPFILSAYSDQSTYNNVTNADKRLYQNCIMPDARSIMRTLAKGLNADMDNVMFEANYDHVAALQESMKEQGVGLLALNKANDVAWKSNVITRNQWLESINQNKIPADKGGDLYYHEFISLYGNQEQSGQGQAGGQQEQQSAGDQNQPNNN